MANMIKVNASSNGKSIFRRVWQGSFARLASYVKTVGISVKENSFEVESDRPSWIPFAHAKHGNFQQETPKLHNQFTTDPVLQSYLKRLLPQEVYNNIEGDLTKFGARVANELYELHLECEEQKPRLTAQNAWGARVDNLWTSPAWKRMHDVSAEEGLVAIGYERKFHEWSRLYQMTKLFLYAPSSGLYGCPLAMTDGAARTFEISGMKEIQFEEAYRRLVSRDPKRFWISGQWMTEKGGGSDVAGGTSTVAVPQGDGRYRLHGYKWFSSATDSDMALTLARITDREGDVVQGTEGLTMFYLETKMDDGKLNNIQLVRLKDKLGTRQLPTAELLLDGTVAYKMSEEGYGVRGISNMLTLTRIHNSLSAVSAMRRVLSLARDYSLKRIAFGQTISKHPLHMQTLARMELEVRGSLLLLLEAAKWLGKSECGKASDEEIHLLRIVIPILKLYTAKQAMSVVSEGLESFGGQGYMEDTGLPGILRDAQVLPIWEGTTNVLSLDVVRSLMKTEGKTLRVLLSNASFRLRSCRSEELSDAKAKVEQAVHGIGSFVQDNQKRLPVSARDLAFSLARTYIGALLIEYASHKHASNMDVVAAQRWCSCQDLTPLITNHSASLYTTAATANDFEFVMAGQPS